MQMIKKLKKKAKEMKLDYLSNISWTKAHYTINEFADGSNATQIFQGEAWNDVLQEVENVIKSNQIKNLGIKDRPRRMKSLGKIKNFEDYEIKVLRVDEFDMIDGKHVKLIELTAGKKEV